MQNDCDLPALCVAGCVRLDYCRLHALVPNADGNAGHKSRANGLLLLDGIRSTGDYCGTLCGSEGARVREQFVVSR